MVGGLTDIFSCLVFFSFFALLVDEVDGLYDTMKAYDVTLWDIHTSY